MVNPGLPGLDPHDVPGDGNRGQRPPASGRADPATALSTVGACHTMREVDAGSHSGAVELSKTLSLPGWPCIRPTAFPPPWAGPPHRTGTTSAPAAGLNPEPKCVLLFHWGIVLNTFVKGYPSGGDLTVATAKRG